MMLWLVKTRPAVWITVRPAGVPADPAVPLAACSVPGTGAARAGAMAAPEPALAEVALVPLLHAASSRQPESKTTPPIAMRRERTRLVMPLGRAGAEPGCATGDNRSRDFSEN